MNNVIFYHIYAVNNWRKIVYEQVRVLALSGLYSNVDRVFCGIVGREHSIQLVQRFIRKILRRSGIINKFYFTSSTENNFEYITLKMLQEYSLNNDSRILYIHTKGVTSPYGSSDYYFKKSWRKCMEHFCIKHWKKCVKELSRFDVCGIFYRENRFRRRIQMCNPNRKDVGAWMSGRPIFSRHYICNKRYPVTGWRLNYLAGNFWWTTTAHVRELPELEKVTDIKLRGYYEKWILHKKRTHILSFYNHRDIIMEKKHSANYYKNY